MDIHYRVGSDGTRGGLGNDSCAILRQEALSLAGAGVRERIALHESISCIRLGLGRHLRVLDDSHLGNRETCAVVCAEIMAIGKSITIGDKPFTSDVEPGWLWNLAYEAARERNRLLPMGAGARGGGTYISPGWPTDEECARLAHKLVRGMGYSQAQVARIFETVDDYERPAVWSRQGIDRLLWEEYEGEKCARFYYAVKSDEEARRGGRQHLPAFSLDLMAVLGGEGAEAAARKYDACLEVPHHGIVPFGRGDPATELTVLLRWINDFGCIRTLYMADPDEVFSTPTQREVFYDLALYRGVRVIEDGAQVDVAAPNPHRSRLLREGTELFAALWVHDNATVMEEKRSLSYARKRAAELRAEGYSLRQIADRLNEEAIPTQSGIGAWGASAIKAQLNTTSGADR